MARDANGVVRAQLSLWIEALDPASARSHTARFAADLDAIRRLATANGFVAVTPVVHALEAALARGERGPAVANGLLLLRDAAQCGDDARSGKLIAAACTLRMIG